MIINEKIKKFVSEEEFNNLKRNIKKNIKNDIKIRLTDILKYFSFEKINYTFDDFVADGYGENVKEKKVMYKIFSMGYVSIEQYCLKHGLSCPSFFKCLKEGFDDGRGAILLTQDKTFISLLEKNCTLENFEIEFYEKHIELYGKKEDLEEFRKEHNIKFPVRYEPIKEKWHLAFVGILAEYIRYKEYAEREKGKSE